MDQFVGIPDVDKNVGLDLWKIPGTNGGKQFADDPRYGGAPAVTGFGFSDIGFLDTWTPVWRHERSYTYQSNFSKIHGAHELRWGLEDGGWGLITGSAQAGTHGGEFKSAV